ncbi:hypothetical protein ACFWR9_25045 [Streptomyces sp. NPDC058534]|uniref:hypothetical protein n=1 Tax=Streptomyces sp. NPDC058534 TaxID=3346541 RepID=UPI00364E4531
MTGTQLLISNGNHDASLEAIRYGYPKAWFPDSGGGYYESEVNGLHVLTVNTETYDFSTAQRAWLKKCLAAITADPANAGKPVLVQGHRPTTDTVMDGEQASNPLLAADLSAFPQGTSTRKASGPPTGSRPTRARAHKVAPHFTTRRPLSVAKTAEGGTAVRIAQAKDDQMVHHYRVTIKNEATGAPVVSSKVLSDFTFMPRPNTLDIPVPADAPAGRYTAPHIEPPDYAAAFLRITEGTRWLSQRRLGARQGRAVTRCRGVGPAAW